jgi:ABC-type uncharacterized transport system
VTHFDAINSLWFVGWLAAMLGLFIVGVRLPLQPRLRRPAAVAYSVAVVVATVGVAVLANVALLRHDAHFDLTRERVFTPSRQAEEVVDGLRRDVKLTYFYQPQDPAGKRARDMVEVLGRRNPRLRVRTVDPDKQPTVAETFGVRIYNAAVLEADGRRVQVMGTDENQIALGILRVLRQRVTTICFMEGHNEYPIDNFEFHTHFEGVAGHSHGDSGAGVVLMKGHGAGRIRRALEALGYDVRAIVPATLRAIPAACAALVDLNPRTTYLPGESEALAAYLAGGGAALLAYDLGFVIEPHLAATLQRLGIVVEQNVVVDPLDHYSTDPEVVAIPVYEAHVITRQLSLSFFPGVRSISLLPPPSGVTLAPLFRSSAESYTRPVRPAAGREVAGALVVAPVAARSGRHVLAVAAEGTFPQSTAGAQPFRLIVIGDGDFASNSFLPYMANADLAISMVRWLVREDQTPAARSRIPVPPLVLLTKRQMQQIFVAVEVFLPLAVIVAGGLVWWRRR